MMDILVAYDGSKYGRWALEWAERLPLNASPRLKVVHVVDLQSVRAPCLVQPVIAGNQRFIREEIQRLEKNGERVLAEAHKSAIVAKLGGTIVTERGAVPQMILAHAPKRHGLVILGNRGLNALDRFMLGSVSMRVALHAPCPVLVIKKPPQAVRRILFATDGSKSSARALGFLINSILPHKTGKAPMEVTIVYAMPAEHSRLNCAVPEIDNAAHKLRVAGFKVSERIETGPPAPTILKVATTQRPDLIVMGAKGLGAVARFFLGSVSYQVLQHAASSVLIIK